MFLRADELLSIKMSDFVPTLFVRKGDHIIAMLLKVKGKCDQKIRPIWVWADDEHPDLCPVRPLLLYIWLSGIKQGSLFPKPAELSATEEAPANATTTTHKIYKPVAGKYVTEIEYTAFLRAFKNICAKALPSIEVMDLRIGLHMFRKTAYLLGIWGGGEWSELKASACHRSDENAKIYRKDARAKKLLAEVHQDPDNAVSKWKPVYACDLAQSSYMNLQSTAFGMQVQALAEDFVKKTLGFRDGHPCQRSQIVLVEAAHKYVAMPSVEDELEKFAEEQLHLEGDLKAKFFEFFQRSVQEKYKQWRDSTEFSASSAPASASSPEVAVTPDIPEEPSKKRKRGGVNSLDGYLQVASLPFGPQKVQKIRHFHDSAPSNLEELTMGAKTFICRTAKPMVACLVNHHGDNLDEFCSTWSRKFKQKFSSGCCNGKGQQCSGKEKVD